MQHTEVPPPMSASANVSVQRGLVCHVAGMSSPQVPITVRLLDGVAHPIAPLGPVWGAIVDPAGLRALVDVVSRSLETPRLREELAHWIVEREPARRKEAQAAAARRAERKKKEHPKRCAAKQRSRNQLARARPWEIVMPPENAPAASVYAAFARAAGSDSARRVAYRFGRLSVFTAECAVDELVDREYRRLRAGDHKASLARFEAALELHEGEELDTLEKVHIVMSVRRAVANSPLEDHEDASDEAPTSLIAEAVGNPQDPDSDDPWDEHYWTPSVDEPSTEVLKVVAASSLDALTALAEYFDPLRVGMALVTPKALPRFMGSVRAVVQGRSRTGVLGKPERPWFEELYAFSRCLGIVGPPDPSKYGARSKDQSGRYRKTGSGKATKQLGHDFEAFRRKLVLGMHDLADEPHGPAVAGGGHRCLDRLRDYQRPVYWSAKRLRERRVEQARYRIQHVIDELPSGTAISVAEILERSCVPRSRVKEVIEALVLEGGLRRLNHFD